MEADREILTRTENQENHIQDQAPIVRSDSSRIFHQEMPCLESFDRRKSCLDGADYGVRTLVLNDTKTYCFTSSKLESKPAKTPLGDGYKIKQKWEKEYDRLISHMPMHLYIKDLWVSLSI